MERFELHQSTQPQKYRDERYITLHSVKNENTPVISVAHVEVTKDHETQCEVLREIKITHCAPLGNSSKTFSRTDVLDILDIVEYLRSEGITIER